MKFYLFDLLIKNPKFPIFIVRIEMKYSDEFIKERERYAIIGDDLDFAFVGQKEKCTFIVRFRISNAVLKNTIFDSDFKL